MKSIKMKALLEDEDEYIPFEPANYIENPVALARIKAHITREELAQRLGVSKGYIAKIERSASLTDKMLARVKAVL
jgi:predicted transcriptional regulator